MPFDPNVKDGRGTDGLARPEVELGQRASTQPPFEAYAVDLRHHLHLRRAARSTPTAQVVDHDGAPIPGLYAAGEMVGGMFYFNYPSGTGLVSGAVFGRLAGASAARSGGGSRAL